MQPKGHYNVRSLYFDDYRNSALIEKEGGYLKRKKYRIRIYDHSDAFIKFERKTRINKYILKESVRLKRDEADRITAGEIDSLADSKRKLLRDFYMECHCNLMQPAVIVEYNREAYTYPIGNVRITFDTSLRTSLGPPSLFDCNACTMNVIGEWGTILEIKYNDVFPQFIRGLFPETIRPQIAAGKFVACRTQEIKRTGSAALVPWCSFLHQNVSPAPKQNSSS